MIAAAGDETIAGDDKPCARGPKMFYSSTAVRVRERKPAGGPSAAAEGVLASNRAEAQVAALERVKSIGLETAKQEKFVNRSQFVFNRRRQSRFRRDSRRWAISLPWQ